VVLGSGHGYRIGSTRGVDSTGEEDGALIGTSSGDGYQRKKHTTKATRRGE
jgi:hypothetical protein